MTGYDLPVPNANIVGIALKIQNTTEYDITGFYTGVGVFVNHGDDANYPLLTVGKEGVTTIPANSTIYIHQESAISKRFTEECRIVVDSTSLNEDCILTPVFLLEVEE